MKPIAEVRIARSLERISDALNKVVEKETLITESKKNRLKPSETRVAEALERIADIIEKITYLNLNICEYKSKNEENLCENSDTLEV